MTNRTLENIQKDAEELEQESITLDLSGHKEDAAEKAENALFKMETVAKARNLTSDYTQLVSYCWNYLVIIRYPLSQEDISSLVASKAIEAQKTAYTLSPTLNEKSNLAGIYRDVCIFLDTGVLEAAQTAVRLSEEIVNERGLDRDYRLMGTCYSRLGLVLMSRNRNTEARNYLDRSLQVLCRAHPEDVWDHIEIVRARMYRALLYVVLAQEDLARGDLEECLDDLKATYKKCQNDAYYPALFLTCSNLIRFCELAGFPEESEKSIRLAVRIYNDQNGNDNFWVNEQDVRYVQDQYTKLLANHVRKLGKAEMSHGEWKNARDLFHLEVYLRGNISERNETPEDQKKLIQSYAHLAKANRNC